MNLLRLFSIAAVLLLSACAASGPVFEPVPAPARGYAVVYVYRPDRAPVSDAPATFYIENVKFASLWSNNYTVVHLPARQFTLRQDWPMVKDVTATLRVPVAPQAGATYYYRLDFKRVPGPAERGLRMEEQWTLQPVESQLALQEMQSARLEVPVNLKRIEKRVVSAGMVPVRAACTFPNC